MFTASRTDFMNRAESFQKIKNAAASLGGEIITLRRHFHENPELSWKEFRTAEKIATILNEEGLAVTSDFAGAGLLAELSWGRPGKRLALRADMDALPVQDVKDVAYRSKNPGVMHACGHDCHIAVAVGVAKILKRLALDFNGGVRFIFQPSEEASPSGAAEMVKAGAMAGVDAVLAYHVYPEIPAGQIGLRPGALTANCNEFKLTIHGRGGHAARPHLAIDAIRLSNQVLSALYEIVGHRKNQNSPAILAIGKITGGAASNIIADLVEIYGTVRTVEEESRREILAAIAERARNITAAGGGACDLEFLTTLDSVRNDPALIELARNVAGAHFGEHSIFNIENVSMGGEDFSCYLEKAPGALIRLGVRRVGEEIRHLHTKNFDVDEAALPFGAALMAMMIVQFLSDDDKHEFTGAR